MGYLRAHVILIEPKILAVFNPPCLENGGEERNE